MAGFRCGRLCALVAAFAVAAFVRSIPAFAQKQEITVTPASVVAGSPELIRVAAPGATMVTGEWLGHKIQFFESRDGKSWLALAGVDVEAKPGASKLAVRVYMGIDTADFSREIDILPAHYRTTTLTVAPRFVEPSPDELKIIDTDKELKKRVFGASAAEALWHGSFRAPVRAAATDSFGTRRTFNGKLASIHKGMDYRARPGTVVRAANSGTVVLARKLYFEGNCVVIDHGLGLYTLSMHLSRMDVHEGERVATGERIGLSGATGRVTGPHLHWAVRWQGAYLDPAKLLRLNLSGMR